MTPSDLASTWLPIGAAACAVLAALWRVHGRIMERFDAADARMTTFSQNQQLLQQALAVSDRDRAKLEGKLELTVTGLNEAVGAVRELTGSTDALWRVMGDVAPDLVRRRNGV